VHPARPNRIWSSDICASAKADPNLLRPPQSSPAATLTLRFIGQAKAPPAGELPPCGVYERHAPTAVQPRAEEPPAHTTESRVCAIELNAKTNRRTTRRRLELTKDAHRVALDVDRDR
jgi:hypothetical protein